MKKIPTATQPKARLSHAAELLFEIGVEELPYQFIAPALSSLEDHAGRLFQEARLSYGSIKAYGLRGDWRWSSKHWRYIKRP